MKYFNFKHKPSFKPIKLLEYIVFLEKNRKNVCNYFYNKVLTGLDLL